MRPRSIRFNPEPLDSALVQFSDASEFTPDAVALILNESFTGSGLLIVTPTILLKGHMIKVKVGRLPELSARVVWVKPLEAGIVKLGIEFTE
jgi:hypothetical protein